MILVLAEHEGGSIDELSLQALALARGLDEPVEALLVGGSEAAGGLGAHGVATVHVAEDERLAAYAPGVWARCLTELLERLEKTRERLESTNDPDAAIDILGELADIAKQVEAELEQARREAGE